MAAVLEGRWDYQTNCDFELSDQDNVALEEISKILERHPDLKLIEMVVEPTLIFNHLIIDTGKRKVYYNLANDDEAVNLL